MSDRLPILKFEPILKEVVWGGRNMARVLGRPLEDGAKIGESWELCDLPDAQSRVLDGALAGQSLEALIAQNEPALLGSARLLAGRFPLLIKFIDANDTLSVQVHPDEAACQRIGDGARPKTEAWYVIDCQPGAVLYAGLKPGVDKAKLADAIASGSVAALLHEKPVVPGDLVYLPAGCIHAIGAGIVLAEVQQSSNTTYRVFDWNRVGLTGQPRELHVDKALAATNYQFVSEPTIEPPRSGRKGVRCAFFELEIVEMSDGDTERWGTNGPLIIMGVGGAGVIEVGAQDSETTVGLGETALVPAARAQDVVVEASGAVKLLVCSIS